MSSVSASVVISKGGEARGDVAGEVGVFIVTVSCCACSWNCMCVGMWWRVRGLTGGFVAMGEMSRCGSE